MENIKTVADGENTMPNSDERTFTQDDLNRIVQERLGKEKVKYEAALEKSAQQLKEQESAFARKEFERDARAILEKHKLTDKLLTVLNVSDVDGLNAALDILDAEFDFKDGKPRLYTKNEDGTWTRFRKGDPPPVHGGLFRGGAPRVNPDPIRQALGLIRKE